MKWGSLGLSVGSVLIAGVLMWSNEGAVVTDPSPPVDAGEKPQANVEKPLIVERKGERIIWRLQADSAKQQEQGMQLIEPRLELFTEQEEVIPISAREAWFEPAVSDIRFSGETVVLFREWRLESEQLQYESGREEVVVPGSFRLFKTGTTLWGDGLRADRKNQRLIVERKARIEDNVYVKKGASGGGKVRISSDSLVIEHQKNRAEFHGSVHLERDDFDLHSDRLVVIYLHETGGEIDRAEAYGHVVMQQGEKRGTSDSAIYRQRANELEMAGGAEVSDNRGTVRGEKLLHHIDTKETSVVQGEAGQRARMVIEDESAKP